MVFAGYTVPERFAAERRALLWAAAGLSLPECGAGGAQESVMSNLGCNDLRRYTYRFSGSGPHATWTFIDRGS